MLTEVSGISPKNSEMTMKNHKITLTQGQQAAFDARIAFAGGHTDFSMAVLEGFAGTGKTTLVGLLLAKLTHLKIAVAAPTNKAVRVLRDKLKDAAVIVEDSPNDPNVNRHSDAAGITFGSIHSFLGLQMQERDDGTQECRAARDPSAYLYDLLVVDECSMIGAELFAHIAVAKRNCRVLFVGDPAQLPPIEPGENLSPTFSRVTLKSTLSEVVRQAAENPIIALSILLRRAIESGQRADTQAMAEILPPLPADAALITGSADTVADCALWDIRAGLDARIVAFTNQAVQAYNYRIHEALYGRTERPFVVGERVIVQQACEATTLDDSGSPSGTKTMLITSEEAAVLSIEMGGNPLWPDVPACRLVLERDYGKNVSVYMADKPQDIERAVSERFAKWRDLKAKAEELRANGSSLVGEAFDAAKHASGQAWALRKAFANLRHVYAITAHKSQGSTFDTAIVDLNDMAKMRSNFAFNRGLYVAATRPSKHLAIVV